MVTKRTYWFADRDGGKWLPPERKITCELTGEMDTGEKVWTEVDTGEQYFCMRVQGVNLFYQM